MFKITHEVELTSAIHIHIVYYYIHTYCLFNQLIQSYSRLGLSPK